MLSKKKISNSRGKFCINSKVWWFTNKRGLSQS